MTVDVILPTHDHWRTVAFAMQAVLRQTHSDLRLHVVGDGCSAEVERAVRSVEDPRLFFHSLPKAKGFGYANRNHVLRQTSAPFVAYATDDDLWFPDHLERALAALEGSLDLVAFRACAVLYPDQLDVHFFPFDWGRRRPDNPLRDWFIGSQVLVHRRALLEEVGYWNDDLLRFGDRDFYNRVRSGRRTAYLDYITAIRFYAIHWEQRYGALDVPPQRDYLELLRDPEFCRHVRNLAADERRTPATRWRQWREFLRFGMRSGPRFVRYRCQMMRKPLR